MVITKHAESRIRERLGLKKKAVPRMVATALSKGKSHADHTGGAKRYLNGLFLAHKTANNLRVYGNFVYVFIGDKLITVIDFPRRFIRYT